MPSTSLQEFQKHAEQIPFLLNGTLPVADRESLNQAIAAEPALARELELQRRIRDAVNQSAATPARSSLPQFLNRLAAESQREVNQSGGNVATLKRSVAPLSIERSHQRGWKIAFALAASLAVIQAAILAPLMKQTTATMEPLSGASVAVAANLQLTFKPEATEKQIREMLRANGVEIVAGPSALGVYQARAADASKAAAALVAQSSVVDSATPLSTKP
jgi:anti-sigma factor RsiW